LEYALKIPMVGLTNVDNISANKLQLSSAQQSALNLKSKFASSNIYWNNWWYIKSNGWFG
jgi:hypothetical protein